MSKFYVQVDNDGIVLGISQLSGSVSAPDMYEITSYDQSLMGRKRNSDGSFSEVPSQTNTLTITLDKPTVAPGETVTATAEVRLPDGTLAPLTANYVVPVFDVDGRKDQMLKVSFVDGQGSASFSFSEPGIYTIEVGKIRPVPTAQLPESPEVVVEPV